LTFTTLFPNSEHENHGVFVENRLRHLVGSGAVVATVLAPVPYFPAGLGGFGAWSRLARVPLVERRHGIVVHHPRYLSIPRIGMSVAPRLLAHAAMRAVGRLMRQGCRFDAIDAHYLYPDGVAAIAVGREFGLPVVMTARGSDVTQLPNYLVPRLAIRRAIASADGLVAVSGALKDAMVRLGASPASVMVLRNGVDTGLFQPTGRVAARAELGVSGKVLISVGQLIERKRHHLTIAAMRALPGFTLLIVGEGPQRARLAAMIEEHGLGERVRLLGAHPHQALPRLYAAADAMILASSREGWANVLLESMACGTPVVATNIWGNPEVVQSREAGLIVDDATPEGIAAGVTKLFDALPDRSATRAYAERFGWQETTTGQVELFRRITESRATTSMAAR
jgi:glycosyltransferase involved in cell wall biosynthesis